MMEILLATVSNLKFLFICLAACCAMALFIIRIESDPYRGHEEPENINRENTIKKTVFCGLIFGLLSCAPTINDLWRVRIALIKYELAAPENVKQATETIERIATKLECKYLGCEEKK